MKNFLSDERARRGMWDNLDADFYSLCWINEKLEKLSIHICLSSRSGAVNLSI